MSRRRFLKWIVGAGAAIVATGAALEILLNTPQKGSTRKLPPGQHEVDSLIELEASAIPKFDEKTWSLQVYGLVTKELTFNYAEFQNLPTFLSISDFNCVTGWD